jgi:hypothetical protein
MISTPGGNNFAQIDPDSGVVQSPVVVDADPLPPDPLLTLDVVIEKNKEARDKVNGTRVTIEDPNFEK